MGLAEFKRIFYFEYSHRLLGRFIGLAFIIPLIIFWIKGYLDRALLKKMLIIFILGGAQGVLGWYMVQSGLVDEPKVSQYRLTAHLGLAIALYGSLIWLATDLFLKNRLDKHTQGSIRISAHATMLLCFVFFMILSGGLVAGLKAGFVWNTFPLMGNTFIPPGLYEMAPFWISALEDMTTVQFNHRILAYIIFVVATVLLVRLMVNDSYAILQRVMLATYISLCCQIILGITTILFAVPVVIGSLHQACAVLVFTLVVVLTKLARFLELPS